MMLIDVERRKQYMNIKVEGDPALSQLVAVDGFAHEKRCIGFFNLRKIMEEPQHRSTSAGHDIWFILVYDVADCVYSKYCFEPAVES